MSQLLSLLARLETIVDGVLDAQGRGLRLDDGAIADAKARVLLELSRLSSGRTTGGFGTDEAAAATRRLREKLAREAALLKLRVEAAELVSALIADAVLAADGDGLYGPRPALGRPGRGG